MSSSSSPDIVPVAMAFDSILSLHFFALRISQMSKALIVYFVSHGMTRKVCVLSTWTVAKNWMPHSNHVGRNTRVQFKFTTIQSLHPFSRIVHSHRRLFVLCVCVCVFGPILCRSRITYFSLASSTPPHCAKYLFRCFPQFQFSCGGKKAVPPIIQVA